MRAPTPTQRGFTVVEVLVAGSLAGLVLAGAIGLLITLSDTSQMQSRRFDDRAGLRSTQVVVRRAMETLVAGIPIDPESQPADGPDEPEDDSPDDDDAPQAGEDPAAPGAIYDDDPLASDGSDEPDYFMLWYEQIEGNLVQRLEIVVRKPLAPDPRDAGQGQIRARTAAYRGAFAARYDPDAGWSLWWEPIAPQGRPRELLRGITRLEWSVLPYDYDTQVWPDIYSAYIREDFPFVVNLIIETESGLRGNWVFETNVVTRGS